MVETEQSGARVTQTKLTLDFSKEETAEDAQCEEISDHWYYDFI